MSLSVLDAFRPFPEAAIGKYDVVHVQLFISLIANNDPAALIKNLMTLLKPGGFLQWTEIDADSGRIVLPKGVSISADAAHQFVHFLRNPQAGHSINWVPQLHDAFAQQGLIATTLDRYVIEPKYYSFWNVNRLWAAKEVNEKLYSSSMKGQEISEMIVRTYNEFQQGVAVTADLIVAIGQKPDLVKLT